MIHLVQKPSFERIDLNAVDFTRSYDAGSALISEEFSYQIVLYNDSGKNESFKVENISGLPAYIYLVRPVAVTFPHDPNDDEDLYVLNAPGVSPDCLVPLQNGGRIMIGSIPTVLWISFRIAFPGKTECKFRFHSEIESAVSCFELNVLDLVAAEAPIRYCEHIYSNEIAKAHNLPLFCNDYWNMLKKYFNLAVAHGVTDLLIPAFPAIYPSLSVYENIQLVEITQIGSEDRYNFDLLDNWIYLAMKSGIRHFVFPPLFPDISKKQCIPFVYSKFEHMTARFGKETTCFDLEYRTFLCQFLRKLVKHIREKEWDITLTFQISDGFTFNEINDYLRCRSMVFDIICKYRILDPVLDRRLYDEGIFATTAISLNKIDDFNDVSLIHSSVWMDPRWNSELSDLLTAGRPERLRSLGTYCFEQNIFSLFNRGFNYEDSLGMYPSGAMSLIYPGSDGPMASVRLKQLLYAKQDFNILQLLSTFVSRKQIRSLIRKKKNIQEFRQAVDRLLAENMNKKK